MLTLIAQGIAGIYLHRRQLEFPGWYKWLQASGVFMLSLVFFTLLYFFAASNSHYYQVWAHVSPKLPLYYKIAAMWEGQEGSFLLWAFIQSCLSLILTFSGSPNLKAASVIFPFLQVFLIIPLVHFPFGGAYLFESTVHALGISDHTLSSQWLLQGGNGMNPLLQSFWMTIHPPCIFTSFGLGSISFSITIAGILREDHAWLGSGFKWLKISLLFLSIGILMGAYWAYETLNFGGYWSWDPVENAIYIPWLLGIGAMHTGWVAKKIQKRTGTAAFLSLLYFVFMVYSTFLTRSGILQNTSVHSFVDEGHHNILIVYLLFVVLSAGATLYFKRKTLFFSSETIRLKSREDWLLIMPVLLLLAAFQVFVNTSIPVLNSFLRFFLIKSDLAPTASTLTYSIWQGIFAVGLGSLLVVIEKQRSVRHIIFFAIASTIVWITMLHDTIQPTAILSILLIIQSLLIFVLLARKIFMHVLEGKISGSSLSHIGFAFLIAGIVLSGKTIITSQAPPAHIYLGFGQGIKIGDRIYRYDGRFAETESGDRIDVKFLKSTFRPDRFLAKDTIKAEEKMFLPGSVVATNSHISWFKITDLSKSESAFSRIYFENQSSYFVSPTIQHSLTKDTYIHVSNFQDPDKVNWKKWDEFIFPASLAGKSKAQARIRRVRELRSFPGLNLSNNRVAFMITLELDKGPSPVFLSPVVVLEKGKAPMFIEDVDSNAGVLAVISLWNDENDFTVEMMRSEKSWITIRHEEKPFINLFWLGGLLISAGIGISIKNRHRRQEQKSACKEQKSVVNAAGLVIEKELV